MFICIFIFFSVYVRNGLRCVWVWCVRFLYLVKVVIIAVVVGFICDRGFVAEIVLLSKFMLIYVVVK